MENIQEKNASKTNGFVVIVISFLLTAVNVFLFINFIATKIPLFLILFIILFIIIIITLTGLIIVQPNESRVLVFFGKYVGTVRTSGFWWVNPFTSKEQITLRIRNFNSEKIKVNDLNGNPIEIGAVVVWKVIDSAKAVFDVEHYEQFVAIQSETAIRSLASEYAYDESENTKYSLRGSPQEVSASLQKQVQQRLDISGVDVIEARISHLAYAPEIAHVMLRRQQAEAVVAARHKIVEGAVSMVEMALKSLNEQNIVQLTEDRKAIMVNNLLVALVSESEAQPVINTSLNQ